MTADALSDVAAGMSSAMVATSDRIETPLPHIQTELRTLREYAAVMDEDISGAELRLARALARGDERPFQAEINRLAARFLDQALEQF